MKKCHQTKIHIIRTEEDATSLHSMLNDNPGTPVEISTYLNRRHVLVREPVKQIQKKSRLSRQQIWRNKMKAQEEINKEIQNRMLSLDNYGVRKSKYPQRDGVDTLYSSIKNVERATAILHQTNSKKRPGSKAHGSSKRNRQRGCVKRRKSTLSKRARKKYKRAKKIVQTAKKKNKPAKIIVQTDASKYGWNPPLETVCKRLDNAEKMKRWEAVDLLLNMTRGQSKSRSS